MKEKVDGLGAFVWGMIIIASVILGIVLSVIF